MDSTISNLILGALALVFSFFLKKHINSASDKNKALTYTQIAGDIVSLIIANNPNLPWRTVMEDAISQIQKQIQDIDPEIAKRVVAGALYDKGVIALKTEAGK
jgi:Na+-transporting NADH:ubiquinone oxidoreductase subunit NqrB